MIFCRREHNMRYQINGLSDIYKVLSNERKVGGVIEAEYVRLRSGDQYENAAIVSIDRLGEAIYSIGFVTSEGKRIISHVDDISMISDPVHKNICELRNEIYKRMKTAEKLKYLKKLLDVNEGSNNSIYKQEADMLINDLGRKAVQSEVDLSSLDQSVLTNRAVSRFRIA
jgi:hypothetical protein